MYKSEFVCWLDEDEDLLLGSFKNLKTHGIDNSEKERDYEIVMSDGSVSDFMNEKRRIGYSDIKIDVFDNCGAVVTHIEGVANEVKSIKNNKELFLVFGINKDSSLRIDPNVLKMLYDRMGGCLEKKGTWQPLSRRNRKLWLKIALLDLRTKDKINNKNKVEIDGAIVDDLTSFLCAFGEAVCGAGAYIGQDITSLMDCLDGVNFDIVPPSVLVWRSFEKSEIGFIQNDQHKEFALLLKTLEKFNIHVETVI